jgi:hypothetical protein
VGGVLLWLAADRRRGAGRPQLQRFKADPANRGAVCQRGLWRYSRHPNYFFEWLVWVAYFMMALASPWGWLTLYCPALMLYFLLRVTGIPLTEQLSLQARARPMPTISAAPAPSCPGGRNAASAAVLRPLAPSPRLRGVPDAGPPLLLDAITRRYRADSAPVLDRLQLQLLPASTWRSWASRAPVSLPC